MAGKSLIGALRVTLGLDSAEFTEGVESARGQMEKTKKSIVEFGDRMSGVGKALTIGVTLPLLAAGAAAVKGAQEQAAAMAQVESAIKSMGNTAGRTAEQLADQADALEMNSLFEGDVILKQVTANLLTFGNVAGEVFDRAQQAAVDMATRLGSEPQAAAIMLGKALNDPVKGIQALNRVGVQLSDGQKEQIKNFVKIGDVAKAQAVILAEVERQFRGAAQAAAETTPWRQAQVAINQTAEQFGAILLPLLPAISDAIIGVAQAIAALSPQMQQIVVIGGLVAASFGPIMVALGTFISTVVASAVPAVMGYIAGMKALIAVEGVASAATLALGQAFRSLMLLTGVVGIIAVVVAHLIDFTFQSNSASRAATDLANASDHLRQTHDQVSNAAEKSRSLIDRLATSYGQARKEALLLADAQRKVLFANHMKAEREWFDALRERDKARGPNYRGGTNPRIADANRDVRVAEENRSKAWKDLRDLERAMNAPPPSFASGGGGGGLDGAAASARRAGAAVRGLGDEAQKAKQKAEELKALWERLFPEDAEIAKFRKERADLDDGLRSGALTVEKYERAWMALRREFIGFTDLMKQPVEIETVGGTESVDAMLQKVLDSSEEKLGGVKKTAEDMRVRVVESFAQMVDGAMRELDRFARGIQSGNILDIVGGLLNALDKFGAIFTGGKGFNLGPLEFGNTGKAGGVPGLASGGSMKIGGIPGVDRNLLSMNGRPLARVSADETMTITPANDVGGARRPIYMDLRGAVMTQDLLDQMNGMVASGIAQAAPGIATMGANQAIATSRRIQARSLSS